MPQNSKILQVRRVCFCPLNPPKKIKKKKKAWSLELKFKLDKSFKQCRLFCGQKKLLEFSWRLHTLWSRTEGEGEQKTYAPKVVFPPILTESSEAPSCSEAGWKFWMRSLSPEISGTVTLDCSFMTENFIFTNILVVPIGKCKKVSILCPSLYELSKKCCYIPPADEGVPRLRKMRDAKKEAYIILECWNMIWYDEYVLWWF